MTWKPSKILCEGGVRLFDPRTLADSNLNHTSDSDGCDTDRRREDLRCKDIRRNNVAAPVAADEPDYRCSFGDLQTLVQAAGT